MKPILIFCLLLAALFASTFLLLAGTLGVDEILAGVRMVADVRPVWTGWVVAGFLFADLFVAVPTLTVSMLSGYFLGTLVGGGFAVMGMLAAGTTGYAISYRWGLRLLEKLCRNPDKLQEAQELFAQRGPAVLILCRAVPILPEVSCCLAGATRMPFWRFLLFYAVGTIPYAFIAAFAGARSTLADPRTAIFVAIGLSMGLWLTWCGLSRHWRKVARAAAPPRSGEVLH